MRYVQRAAGLIVAHYANLQPEYAEEALADDDAELVAYNNAQEAVREAEAIAAAARAESLRTIVELELSSNLTVGRAIEVLCKEIAAHEDGLTRRAGFTNLIAKLAQLYG